MEDEPAAKKAKLSKKSDIKPPRQELHSSRSGDVSPQPQIATAYQESMGYQQPTPYQSTMEAPVPESQQQLYQEDLKIVVPPAQIPAPIAPAVSSVTITRRDPRMARHSASVAVTYTAPEKPIANTAEVHPAPVTVPVEVGPKAPLPMPPAPPPAVAVSKSAKTRCSISSRFFYNLLF